MRSPRPDRSSRPRRASGSPGCGSPGSQAGKARRPIERAVQAGRRRPGHSSRIDGAEPRRQARAARRGTSRRPSGRRARRVTSRARARRARLHPGVADVAVHAAGRAPDDVSTRAVARRAARERRQEVEGDEADERRVDELASGSACRAATRSVTSVPLCMAVTLAFRCGDALGRVPLPLRRWSSPSTADDG